MGKNSIVGIFFVFTILTMSTLGQARTPKMRLIYGCSQSQSQVQYLVEVKHDAKVLTVTKSEGQDHNLIGDFDYVNSSTSEVGILVKKYQGYLRNGQGAEEFVTLNLSQNIQTQMVFRLEDGESTYACELNMMGGMR